ncbi:MAG: hypothetical protein J0L73_14160 [Verrucomicrobia bacterium]|nr:hypothetical protein [Verrucomicrobiota bacterium]
MAPKVPLSSSAPKLTPQQQAKIPHITQTAKTLLAKLTATHASQFPDLKNPIIESADVCDVTQSGMWLNEDYSIGYHLPTLAAEMAIHNDHAIPGHIETRFNNLLQASPEYNSPVQKTAPQQFSQSGTQPGVNAPNTFTTVEIGIKPHLKEWGRIDGEIHQWKHDFQRAARTRDTLAMDRIKTNIDALEVQRQGLVDQVHRLLEMPSGMRIPFTFADLTPTTRTAAIRGASLAERYIHPDLLPKMGAVDFNSKRAGQFRSMLLIHRLSDPSSVLHEIAHGVEEKSKNVRDKCIGFLKKRAGNEKPQQLSQLEGDKTCTSDELAFEDEFASRGGSHYMGKLYPNGTELLTMGIERLHADPIEFYVNDPEYFAFVINTLQHP